jgi:hypothetical protein
LLGLGLSLRVKVRVRAHQVKDNRIRFTVKDSVGIIIIIKIMSLKLITPEAAV